MIAITHLCFLSICVAGARNLRQSAVCGASAQATATAQNGGSATSTAQAQAICDALSSGSGVATVSRLCVRLGGMIWAVCCLAAAAGEQHSCNNLVACTLRASRARSTSLPAFCTMRLAALLHLYCTAVMQAVADAAAKGNAQTAAEAIAQAASGSNAQAQAQAVAEAINAALTCSCAAGPATAQALSQAIASAGGCGNVGKSLAGRPTVTGHHKPTGPRWVSHNHHESVCLPMAVHSGVSFSGTIATVAGRPFGH